MFKKLATAAAALSLGFTLIGCGNDNTQAVDQKGADFPEATLVEQVRLKVERNHFLCQQGDVELVWAIYPSLGDNPVTYGETDQNGVAKDVSLYYAVSKGEVITEVVILDGFADEPGGITLTRWEPADGSGRIRMSDINLSRAAEMRICGQRTS